MILIGAIAIVSGKLTETIAWQQLQYKNLPRGSVLCYITFFQSVLLLISVYILFEIGANFIGANNIPFGIAFHTKTSRLFVGVARRREGIPATLSYINVDLNSYGYQRSPALNAYPNYQTHTLNGQVSEFIN